MSARQTSLVNLQENLTRASVVRASDDPVSAAQAERALTRISRIQTEQRALENQRNAIAQAESTMGDAISLVQEARQLMVNAGNGALSSNDRATIANQLQTLRDQLTAVANRTDTNGIPLLGHWAARSRLYGAAQRHTGLRVCRARQAKRPVMASRCPTRWTVTPPSCSMPSATAASRRNHAGQSTVIVPGATHPACRHGPAQPWLTTSAITVAEGTNFNKNPVTGWPHLQRKFSTVTLDPATNTLSATYNVTSTDPAFVPPADKRSPRSRSARKANSTSTACRQGCR